VPGDTAARQVAQRCLVGGGGLVQVRPLVSPCSQGDYDNLTRSAKDRKEQ